MTDWVTQAGQFLRGNINKSAQYGQYYSCKCPVHDDQKKSLSIRDDGGTPRVNCFAGCDDVQIMEYLVANDVWPKDHPALLKQRKDLGHSTGAQYKPAPRPVKTPMANEAPAVDAVLVPQREPCNSYPFWIPQHLKLSNHGPWTYQLANNHYHVLSIFRFDDKSARPGEKCEKEFRQLTPRSKNGDTVQWESQGLRMEEPFELLPYGHEFLPHAETVLFVEGEKCVDAVNHHGDPALAAITIPGNFYQYLERIDFSVLNGKTVIIWPDFDEPGFKKAELLFAFLSARQESNCHYRLGCMTDQDLSKLQLRPKEDVADYLAASGNLSVLKQLLASLNKVLVAIWSKEEGDQFYSLRNDSSDTSGFYIHTKNRFKEDVVVEYWISNFLAWIASSRQIYKANGEMVSESEICGIIRNEPLPVLKMDSRKIDNLQWIGAWRAFGAHVNSNRDFSGALSSYGATQRITKKTIVHEAIGWREIEGRWYYLHGHGTTPRLKLRDGRASVTCEPGGANKSKVSYYKLPTAISVDHIRLGCKQNMSLLSMAAGVSDCLWSSIWIGLFSGDPTPDFVLFLAGGSGSYKSSLAAAVVAHFGDFHYNRLPADFESTVLAASQAACIARDAVVVYDDFRSGASQMERNSIMQIYSRVVRDVGNQTARSSLTGDHHRRPEYLPSSMPIMTGEHWPSDIESGLARQIGLPLTKNSLTDDQRRVIRHWDYTAFTAYMTSIIEAIAPEYPAWRDGWKQRLQHYQLSQAFELSDYNLHGRIVKSVQWLCAGLELGFALTAFAAWQRGDLKLDAVPVAGDIEGWAAVAKQLIKPKSDMDRLTQHQKQVIKAGVNYQDVIHEKSFPRESIHMLYELIQSGNPKAFVQSVPLRHDMLTNANIIGYEDGSAYYMKPDTTMAALQMFASQSGKPLFEDKGAIFENWMNAGLVEGNPTKTKPSERYFRQYTIPNSSKRIRVLKISKSAMDLLVSNLESSSALPTA